LVNYLAKFLEGDVQILRFVFLGVAVDTIQVATVGDQEIGEKGCSVTE
jgi:hypothetical protein